MLPSQNLCDFKARRFQKKKVHTQQARKKIGDANTEAYFKNVLNENRFSLPMNEKSVNRYFVGLPIKNKALICNQLAKKSEKNINVRRTEVSTKQNVRSGLYNLRQMKKYPISDRFGNISDYFLINNAMKRKPKIRQEELWTLKPQKNKITTKNCSTNSKIRSSLISKSSKNGKIQKKQTLPSKKFRKAMTEANKTIEYETATIQGSKNFNQDYIKCEDNIWILCDGHGQHGHLVSQFVSEVMIELCKTLKQNNRCSNQAISQIFTEVQELLQDSQIDIYLSGSTCTLMILNQNQLICANVGDSPAMIIGEQQKTYQTIFTEHKPCNNQERKRIEFFGGVVKKHPSKSNLKDSPLRLWGANEDQWGPGLAVSRGFGDKMARKYGLICQPSISRYSLDNDYKYIVIGSDGLFDKIPYSELQFLVQRQSSTLFKQKQLCQTIAKIARKRWSTYADDVSSIIIYL